MGNGDGSPPYSDIYITRREFHDYCVASNARLEVFQTALWGATGTNGIVKDIHDIKMQFKFWGAMSALVGAIGSSLLTAIMIKMFGL